MKHDFDTAQQQFAGAFAPLAAAASLPVADAAGHVLAAPLTAVLDQPPADQSAMDGYAVRHADLAHGEPLRVAQRCYAGDTPAPLAPRTAARLFTGSLIPPGADTVVMQEHAHEQDGGVTFDAPQRIGSHIRRRGEEVRAGDLLVPAGVRMGAMHVGVAAAQGFARIDVRAALRVGILTTGDELVACGQPRAPQQIYNSNAPMLAALAAGTGADVAMSLHAADTPAAVERALRDLHARCDLVICVGGASVGDKDLLRPALAALGASFLVTGVRMKPGKPVALARLDARPVVLLPGNPGAAMTAFALFVAPLIRRLQGRDACLPVVPSLPIDTGFEPDAQRERFVRVRRIVGADGAPMLDTLRQQGAGTLQSLVQATGLARLPAGRTLARGDAVPYYEFAPWLA
ncbi:molybdopterin molybdotransferase MoeA [Burkholderia cenocepacia]|jgi:molybdopterin molybdotransferase|uniref:molybdopterin molybdotransferase MoeA n=1 Tax=Burkholderia cenocepacia TaxID=95486 RepID=UPI0004F7053B|nr:gephyrin-like molybdotransferase Glp [Burkholderia cenocepacia]AIO43746.1 molybdenum cofactor synthesis domain protein [Burkholderia cepacia]KGC05013.1 molybdenum cofactor synthesis domain protein [Burkholderia cepacia]MBR8384610.1 molybdopterin molybdotransferase MoeA [Burkholderia cenocepacia]MCG0582217.1 molybdopterin molybdotransferase MoeA [Burkholderia cenocepacia]MCW3528218.1 molybdopterin molybdotransferase MoeA [Burkholderia cenocepacia]